MTDMENKSATQRSEPELAKAYEFSAVEKKWYDHWEQQEMFTATMEEGKPRRPCLK